jgi:hypothetical protein
MTREDVVRASREFNFNTLSNYGAQLFVLQYCVHKGKDPQQSKLFVTVASNKGILIDLFYEALEWAEREFSITKLYAAESMYESQGNRRLLQIF